MANEAICDEAMARCRSLIDRAEELSMKDPLAMSLATVDGAGCPSVRMVLLREFDERGFVFYTNAESRKGEQLAHNPRAAICLYWEELREQLRAEGVVERVSDQQSDAYWSSRSRVSQLAACASRQSHELRQRQLLGDDVARLDREYAGQDVPRPNFWYGFRLIPIRIEFWTGRDGRMHERTLYERDGQRWIRKLLYP